MSRYVLHLGDCLEVMRGLEAQSVDAIITDLPYGTTACSWDEVIPFAPMWEAVRHVLKPKGAFVTTASQPFTSKLIMSNLGWFKYEWIWKKSKPNGWQHAQNKPMKTTEDILVFSPAPMGHVTILGENRMTFNPQGVKMAGKNVVSAVFHGRTMGARPNQIGTEYQAYTGFPSNFLDYPNIVGSDAIHPTQKPVALYEYLIRTYTNDGETVIDMTMGSGTTGVAAMRTGRLFVGIELDAGYFAIAQERIANAAGDFTVTAKERASGQISLFEVTQ
jgi:site-specific DNA-methyltransferase (adenine-specific)